jgi:hypothetical protein
MKSKAQEKVCRRTWKKGKRVRIKELDKKRKLGKIRKWLIKRK